MVLMKSLNTFRSTLIILIFTILSTHEYDNDKEALFHYIMDADVDKIPVHKNVDDFIKNFDTYSDLGIKLLDQSKESMYPEIMQRLHTEYLSNVNNNDQTIDYEELRLNPKIVDMIK